MRPVKKKFFLALVIAVLLLLGGVIAYSRYAQQTIKEKKKAVAVCGKT